MWEPLGTKKHGRAGLSKCSQSAVTQSEAQGKLGNVPSAESWHCWVYPQGAHRKQDAEAQSPTAHNRAREHQWGKPSYEGDRKACLGLPSPASNVSLRLPTITQAERTFPHFIRGPCCCAEPLAPPALAGALSHLCSLGRWRRRGTTCSYERSWRPPRGLALRRCHQPPARTLSPAAPRVPLPHCQRTVSHLLWRHPMRGRGSWPSR